MNKLDLQKKAVDIRKGIVSSVHSAKAGHPGGSLSAADIFTYLYFEELHVDPKNPKDENRDRFVLSKGHTAPGYYSALAERGFFPVEDLLTLRHIGSYLQGHPDMKHIPGVDMSSGSLGQGLSAAVGMALAAKMSGKEYRTYCLCGDGEIQEGQMHSIIGGLGSAVMECLAEKNPVKVTRIGVRDTFGESGPAKDLLHKYELDAEGIYKQIKAAL